MIDGNSIWLLAQRIIEHRLYLHHGFCKLLERQKRTLQMALLALWDSKVAVKTGLKQLTQLILMAANARATSSSHGKSTIMVHEAATLQHEIPQAWHHDKQQVMPATL
ncbi:hypothetical protein P7K49_003234 [Saguinus oedipus]|uniref:Uncharacterized protein n=1 Tax=Saguinus oedipus TaxID=9490 RepID=A0ABQ9WJL0_SAGOE|nr:hypothetical protein P7K49_003234 [Saguinus oedipus]